MPNLFNAVSKNLTQRHGYFALMLFVLICLWVGTMNHRTEEKLSIDQKLEALIWKNVAPYYETPIRSKNITFKILEYAGVRGVLFNGEFELLKGDAVKFTAFYRNNNEENRISFEPEKLTFEMLGMDGKDVFISPFMHKKIQAFHDGKGEPAR